MAVKGYWAVCEEIYAPTHSRRVGLKTPSMCMVYVDGFFYADTMAPSRFEAVMRATKNLKENVRFLLDCYQDLPMPSYSDTPPRQTFKDGVTLLFIPIKDIGLCDADFLSDPPKMAA